MDTDPREQGCLCAACGRRFRVDVLVDDLLWARIKPSVGELLCGPCVLARVEALGEFGAFRLAPL